MTGTILNVIAIFIGGILGIFLGGKIPDRVRTTVVSGLGFFYAGIRTDFGVDFVLDLSDNL